MSSTYWYRSANKKGRQKSILIIQKPTNS